MVEAGKLLWEEIMKFWMTADDVVNDLWKSYKVTALAAAGHYVQIAQSIATACFEANALHKCDVPIPLLLPTLLRDGG